jgi:hypothetical protein
MRAYWDEGRDIGDMATLADIAGEAGMDRAATLRLLQSDADAEDIAARDADARAKGVNSVPTFLDRAAICRVGRATARALGEGHRRTQHPAGRPVELSVKPVSQVEFVAIIAMLFATIAISIDAMLPALPDIAATLSPDAPNAAQLVVTSFVLGMGVGTLFAGPLSDAFGRKRVIMLGSGALCAGGARLLSWPPRWRPC